MAGNAMRMSRTPQLKEEPCATGTPQQPAGQAGGRQSVSDVSFSERTVAAKSGFFAQPGLGFQAFPASDDGCVLSGPPVRPQTPHSLISLVLPSHTPLHLSHLRPSSTRAPRRV